MTVEGTQGHACTITVCVLRLKPLQSDEAETALLLRRDVYQWILWGSL